MIPINSIRQSFQFEGEFAGVPSITITLQHDTSNPAHKVDNIDDATHYSDFYWTFANRAAIYRYVNALSGMRVRHVIINGDEPFSLNEQELIRFVGELMTKRYSVQIVTPCTLPIPKVLPRMAFITGKTFEGSKPEIMYDCDEIIHSVSKKSDIAVLEKLIADMPDPNVWLQPVSRKNNAVQLCMETCFQHGFKLSTI